MASDLNTSDDVEHLTLKDAIERISAAGLSEKCADLVAALTEAAKGIKPADAIVYLAKYSFGDHAIQGKGRFSPPRHASLPSAYTDHVPICLVIKNTFEAYLPPADENGPDSPRCLRLLQAGDLFGTFEVANRLCNSDHQKDEWWVSAGVRSVRLAYPLDSNEVLHYANDTIKSSDALLSKFIKTRIIEKANRKPQGVLLEDRTWQLMECLSRKFALDWRAEILLFASSWLRGKTSYRLQNEILKSAWTQAQDEIRRALLRQTITDVASNTDVAIYDLVHHKDVGGETGVQLLTCLADVVEQRTIVHVPFGLPPPDPTQKKGDVKQRSIVHLPLSSSLSSLYEQTVDQAGPFYPILKQISPELVNLRRGDKTMTPVVLVPTYLLPGTAGFLSFSRPVAPLAILPSLANPSLAKRVPRMLSNVGTNIKLSIDELTKVIPKLDWRELIFYAEFQYEDTHFKKLGTLARTTGKNLHCLNKFFQHCVHVTSRS